MYKRQAHNTQQRVEHRTIPQNSFQSVSSDGGGIGKRASYSQQKPGHRQDGDGKHEAAPHSLQYTKNFIFHTLFLSRMFCGITGLHGIGRRQTAPQKLFAKNKKALTTL